MRKQSKVTLYECLSCGHMYQQKVTSCDCTVGEKTKYRRWIAFPKDAVPKELLTKSKEEVYEYPILNLDFDGVVHSYKSGWKGPTVINDPPVNGALRFIVAAQKHFTVAIYSSRSHATGGIDAMRNWLIQHLREQYGRITAARVVERIVFPQHKPPSVVTIDDRAITFTGEWPAIKDLLQFKPWNKQ